MKYENADAEMNGLCARERQTEYGTRHGHKEREREKKLNANEIEKLRGNTPRGGGNTNIKIKHNELSAPRKGG